jgi:EpsI family protein
MRARIVRYWVVGVALAAAALAAEGFKPTQRLADARPRVDLEAMVPAQFGDWRASDDVVPLQPTPEVTAKLDRFYGQVLARTYVDRNNRRVMLSIAWGGDQSSDRMQAHRPEYCYAAQGFDVRPVRDEKLATGAGEIPVRRLLAQRTSRQEPITYWITVGDRTALPGIDRKLAQLRFGLSGTIPDGMLVRVSSLDADLPTAYELQDRFIRALLGSMGTEARARFAGAS